MIMQMDFVAFSQIRIEAIYLTVLLSLGVGTQCTPHCPPATEDPVQIFLTPAVVLPSLISRFVLV